MSFHMACLLPPRLVAQMVQWRCHFLSGFSQVRLRALDTPWALDSGCSARRACPWGSLTAHPHTHVLRGPSVPAPQSPDPVLFALLEIPSPLAASPSSLLSIQEGLSPSRQEMLPGARVTGCPSAISSGPGCSLSSSNEDSNCLPQPAWAFTRKGGFAALSC